LATAGEEYAELDKASDADAAPSELTATRRPSTVPAKMKSFAITGEESAPIFEMAPSDGELAQTETRVAESRAER
jgi:hypothetical protein